MLNERRLSEIQINLKKTEVIIIDCGLGELTEYDRTILTNRTKRDFKWLKRALERYPSKSNVKWNLQKAKYLLSELERSS